MPLTSPYVTGSVGLNPTITVSSNLTTTGALGLAVGNAPYDPLWISVTSSLPVSIVGSVTVTEGTQVSVNNFPATQNVSGTVGVNNFPLTQNVSGTVTANVTATGSAGLLVAAPQYAPVWMTGSVGLNPVPVITANTATTGTSGLMVGAPSYNPVWVTGSVGLNPVPVITANTATTGTSGLMVGAPSYNPVWVTGSVGLTTTVNSSTATTGTLGLAVGNASYNPLWVTITSSLPVTFAGLPQLQISNFPATQNVSGTVGINNFPSVQAISGSQLTGSTFGGSPVVVGGAWFASSSGPAYVKSLQVDVSGALYVTTTGTLPVSVIGTVVVAEGTQVSVNNFPATQMISGTVGINNFPATQNISGSVSITSTAPLSIWNAGTVGVSGTVGVNNFPLTQNVSGTLGAVIQNWPAILGVSGTVGVNNFPLTQNVSGSVSITSTAPLSVWNAGLVGISGTVGVNNFPATQNVSGTVGATIQNWPATVGVSGTVGINNFPAVLSISGSQLSGSTFSGYPLVVGGVWFASASGPAYVRSLQTDISGALLVTVSSSLPVTIGNWPAIVGVSGTVGVNNFPATQNVSGTVGAVIQNWPAILGVSSSSPLSVWNAGTVGVSGTVGINNFPGTQNVSGTVTANVTTTGSTGLLVAAPQYAPVWMTGSVGLNPVPVITANTATTGTSGLMVGAPSYNPVWVTGSVGLNPSPTITANTATTGTLGLAVGNAPYNPLWITITSSLPVTFAGLPQLQISNFPATQNISGTVGVNNFPATQMISGTVGVNNFPLTQNVSGSVSITATAPLSVWNAGAVGVSGTVGINNFPSTQNISGTIGVNNFPGVQAVSGSQLTGSTFGGSPIVVGGVWFASSSGPAYVKSLQTDVSGAVYVTTTGTLPVSIVGQVQVSNFPGTQNVSGTVGAVIQNWPSLLGVSGTVGVNNFPLTQNVSGSVSITATAPLSVWNAGLVGISGTVGINNFPATQNVSGTVGAVIQNWPAIHGVTGTVGVNNFPAVLSVSGSQLSGSTFSGFPIVMGGVWFASASGPAYVKSLQTDVSGALLVTVSSSLPVTIQNWPAIVGVSGTVGVNNFPATQMISGTVGINNFPGTQNVSGSVSIVSTAPLSVWNAGTVGVSGTVGVNNFPLTQNVSGTVTANVTATGSTGLLVAAPQYAPVWVTGSVGLTTTINSSTSTTGTLGLAVGNASYNPLWVTITSSLPVTFAGLPQLSINNFPATQNVSGSVTVTTTGSLPVTGTVSLSGPLPAGANTLGFISLVDTSGHNANILVPVGPGGAGSGSLQVAGQGVTGSTFIGYPVVGGGVWFASASGPAYVRSLQTDVSGNLYITGSVVVQVTGSGLLVAAPSYAPVWVTGSVGITTSIQSSTATTGTLGLAIGNAPYNPLWITVTSSLPVTFAGLPPLSVWNAGPVGVSGTVGINNFPGTQNVSGSITVGTWGTNVTSSVNNPDTFGFGAITAASTSPISASAASFVSVNANGRATVGVQIDGTWTGTLQFEGTVDGHNWWGTYVSPPLTGTAVTSATTNGSWFGSVTGFSLFRVRASTLSSGTPIVTYEMNANSDDNVFVVNSTSSPVYISVTSSLPVAVVSTIPQSVWNASAVGVSGTLQVWESGPVGVSGTVGINNFPAVQAVSGTIRTWDGGVQAVSGSQLTGSTFGGSPVVIGGVWFASASGPAYVKSLQTDVSGNLFVTGTVAAAGTLLTGSTFAGYPVVVGGVFNNTLGYGIKSLALDNAGSVFVVTSGSLAVTTTGTLGLQVANSAVQPIWVTATSSIAVTTTGSAGMLVALTGTVLKGTQGLWAVPVQNLRDSGRTQKCFATSSLSGSFSEGLVTLQGLSNFAISGTQLGQTNWGPTANKTLRLQSFSAAIISAATSNASNIIGSAVVRLRVAGSGSVTAQSPVIATLTPTIGGSSLGSGGTTMIGLPDGVELTGLMTFGVTSKIFAQMTGTLDICVTGFEY